MTATLAILPIFGVIVLGYVLGRRQWLTSESLVGLRTVTFQLFMPCLLFLGIARAPLGEVLSPWLLLAYYLPALGVFMLINLWVWRRSGESTVLGLAGSYSNNVLIGLPMAASLFGDDGLMFVYAILAFHSLILFSAHSLFAAIVDAQGQKLKPLTMLRGMINPIIVGLMLGGVVNLLGITLPATLITMLDWLGRAALPCALLVLGVGLTRYRLHVSVTIGAVTALKLMLFPALVALMTAWLPGISPMARQVVVLLAAGPIGVNVLAFVTRPEQQRDIGACIFLSTLMAALTLPVWVAWMHG